MTERTHTTLTQYPPPPPPLPPPHSHARARTHKQAYDLACDRPALQSPPRQLLSISTARRLSCRCRSSVPVPARCKRETQMSPKMEFRVVDCAVSLSFKSQCGLCFKCHVGAYCYCHAQNTHPAASASARAFRISLGLCYAAQSPFCCFPPGAVCRLPAKPG
jgi:hypothetical protein